MQVEFVGIGKDFLVSVAGLIGSDESLAGFNKLA